MDIVKEAGTMAGQAVASGDLALINALARRELKAEEVYTFCVRLCDNEVDRDGERFPQRTLEELAGRFVGKSGVFDHQWSALGQTARIYRTELVREEGTTTTAGDGYCYLKGYAYMLRCEKNRDLIREIEGGIKKEVSVGCAVERSVCSICGGDMGECAHEKGRRYGGKLCFAELTGAADAYEWSFVAVPAQPRAGVLKGLGREDGERLKRLEREAALGRRYLERLREKAVRLAALAGPGLEPSVLRGIAEKLDEEELQAVCRACGGRLEEKYPLNTQLSYHSGKEAGADRDGAFLI